MFDFGDFVLLAWAVVLCVVMVLFIDLLSWLVFTWFWRCMLQWDVVLT